MANLASLVSEFERFWPSSHAEEWDRVGLVSGEASAEIDTVLVAVDLTEAVIDEAISINAQLVLTHHPVLLKPIVSVSEDKLKGKLLARLIRNNIAVFSAHTNADVQSDGASSLMATAFGMSDLEPLIQSAVGFGHGVIGNLHNPMSLASFSKVVSNALPRGARKVVFSGNPDAVVTRVSVCSGAGDSFLPAVLESDAQVYVTSDLRHHPTQDAISTPRMAGTLNLIDVSHWAAESLWVSAAIQRIESFGKVTSVASAINTDPWTQEVD